MRILFIRHGNPNYEKDCLTDLGHLQAAAVSKRLVGEGIEKIYTSTCGRAAETAEYTSKELGLPVTPLEFMREIRGSSLTAPSCMPRATLGKMPDTWPPTAKA